MTEVKKMKVEFKGEKVKSIEEIKVEEKSEKKKKAKPKGLRNYLAPAFIGH